MTPLDYPLPDEFQDPLSDYEPRSYGDALQAALAEETVAAMDCRPYAEIEPEATVAQALRALSGLQVACLLVVAHRRLLGVFTERDALERVAGRYDEVSNRPVREVMTTNPVVLYETDAAGAALSAIAVAGYRHVPVIGINNEVVGVLSPRRVLRFIHAHLPG